MNGKNKRREFLKKSGLAIGSMATGLSACSVKEASINVNFNKHYKWKMVTTSPPNYPVLGEGCKLMANWIYKMSGGRMEIELYEPFGLIPLPRGNTGQQAGGWYNKDINSYKGLKIRIPGIRGKITNKVGGISVLVAGSKLYTSLELGVIDATEWTGPYHDYKMGFHRVAKNYYFPDWHELGTVLEATVNKSKFEELPSDLKEIIVVANDKLNNWMLLEFETQNAIYLQKIIDAGTQIKRFPDEILEAIKVVSNEVIQELVECDSSIKKVFEHCSKFENQSKQWKLVSKLT